MTRVGRGTGRFNEAGDTEVLKLIVGEKFPLHQLNPSLPMLTGDTGSASCEPYASLGP
jgi:hypothetical protein